MPVRLTQRQNQTYEFIRAYFREHKKPPTMEEIGAALSIRSMNGVTKHLVALDKKGYIRRLPNVARGIELVDAAGALGADVPSLPLISRTNSARPHDLRRRPRGYIYADPLCLGDAVEDDCVVGRAGDDGMSGLGIFKGDYLFIEERRWQQLGSGLLVAALVGDLLLARTFHRSRVTGHITLKPEDKSYSDATFGPRDEGCHVVGPVLSTLRVL